MDFIDLTDATLDDRLEITAPTDELDGSCGEEAVFQCVNPYRNLWKLVMRTTSMPAGMRAGDHFTLPSRIVQGESMVFPARFGIGLLGPITSATLERNSKPVAQF